MSFPDLNKTVKYSVEIDKVKELILRGSADLDFWKEKLKIEGLFPASINGKAKIFISSTNAIFNALRFREVSIYVGISAMEDGGTIDGMYLVHAYNSSPLLAMLERRLFFSPHSPGYIQANLRLNTSLRLIVDDTTLIDAEMALETYVEVSKKLLGKNEIWEGPVFLPDRRGLNIDKRRFFYTRMDGLTYTIPFAADKDLINIRPRPDHIAIRYLLDSNFSPDEWAVRENAEHLKSKTHSYPR